MDISVIVPIYGVENYIKQCLYSLFNQTKTDNVEFILVNDCTPDNSVLIANKIISNFPNLNIRIINHKTNRGLAAARQTGFDHSCGEYILHIDSDDWCELNMLEEMYNEAKKTDADVLICDFYSYSSASGNNYCRQANINNISIFDMLRHIKISPFLWCRLIKRSIYTENSLRWIEGADYAEDMHLTLKMYFLTSKIFNFNRAFVHYRQNTNSICQNLDANRELEKVNNFMSIYDFIINNKIEIAYKAITRQLIIEKCMLLQKYKGLDQKKLSAVYPHTTAHILSCKDLKLHQRIALYLASKGLLNSANFIWKTIKVIHNLKFDN